MFLTQCLRARKHIECDYLTTVAGRAEMQVFNTAGIIFDAFEGILMADV